MFFFPHSAYWLKELFQTPDTGGLGWIVGICGRAAGVHTGVLHLLFRAGTSGGGRAMRSRSSQGEPPALWYPFSSCTESLAWFSWQLSRHSWYLTGGQSEWDKSSVKKKEEQKLRHLSGTKQTIEVSFLYKYPLKHKSKYRFTPILFSDVKTVD